VATELKAESSKLKAKKVSRCPFLYRLGHCLFCHFERSEKSVGLCALSRTRFLASTFALTGFGGQVARNDKKGNQPIG